MEPTTHAITGTALIQSTFDNGKFEAVLFSQGKLIHSSLDNSETASFWRRGQARKRGQVSTRWGSASSGPITDPGLISEQATGPGSIIQSNFGSPGNFEVVVPERDGLVHYWHDNSNVFSAWFPGTLVAPGSTGPGSMVQNRENGNLEVVVLHGRDSRHYRRDSSGWHPRGPITTKASGPACLIQSTYWNNLELVVLEGSNLVHYRRSFTLVPPKWKSSAIITNRATGPAGFCQGSYGDEPNPNFEVVVPEGDVLVHYWRDNRDGNLPWYPGGAVTPGAGPVNAAGVIQSSFQANLEVLSQENDGSVYHYYRFWDDCSRRVQWFRITSCLKVTEL